MKSSLYVCYEDYGKTTKKATFERNEDQHLNGMDGKQIPPERLGQISVTFGSPH